MVCNIINEYSCKKVITYITKLYVVSDHDKAQMRVIIEIKGRFSHLMRLHQRVELYHNCKERCFSVEDTGMLLNTVVDLFSRLFVSRKVLLFRRLNHSNREFVRSLEFYISL